MSVFYVTGKNNDRQTPTTMSSEQQHNLDNQPKRTFPWDYTTHSKASSLQSSTPEVQDGFSDNDLANRSKDSTQQREVKFAMDNPTFDEPTHLEDKYLPHEGTPFDTSSRKIRNVETESGVRETHELEVQTGKRDERKGVRNGRCCSYRALVVVVIVLVLLFLVMTALFVWRMLCCKTEDKVVTPTIMPAALVISTGCRAKPNSVPFETIPKSIQTEFDNFQAFIEKAINKKQAVAFSANVVYRDKVIWEGAFGVMNKTEQHKRVPSVRTVYPCASVSKIITALMLFKLVTDERVKSLNDRVTRYSVDFSVKNPFNNHQITLRELATQRSGLQREAPCYPTKGTNLCPYDNDIMMNRIKNLTLVAEPGTKPQYSNLAYSVLGHVLLNAFGSSSSNFDQWIKTDLFSKIGMTSSSFSVNNSQISSIPVGYLGAPSFEPIHEWGWLQPTGGLFSSVHDLAKLEIELMSDKTANRILSKALTEEYFRPDYMFHGGKSMVGTPWEIINEDGYLVRTKRGYIYGYSSYVALVPEIKLAINALCTDCSSLVMHTQFKKILSAFDGELTRASMKNLTLPPDSQPFIGRYNSDIPTIQYMEVREKVSFLVLAVNGFEAFFLNYTAPLTFRLFVNPLLDCMASYEMGVKNDVVVFDEPSQGKSPGFTMFSAHPSGRSYFPRTVSINN